MKLGVFCALLGTILSFISLHFIRLCLKKNDIAGKRLSLIFTVCIPVVIAYLLSIQMRDKTVFAICSAIYYCGITVMLYTVLLFTCDFVDLKPSSKLTILIKKILPVISALDILIEASNPFFNYYAIDYTSSNFVTPAFNYSFRPLYICHLTYCYILIILFVILLTVKTMSVPKGYRLQYLMAIGGLAAIVFVNAMFLYLPKDSVYARLDYSIVGYLFVAVLMYWINYTYATFGMMNRFKSYVFSSIEQGIVLFDFEDNMILWNDRAKSLIPNLDYNRNTELDRFTEQCSIEIDKNLSHDNRTFQCYVKGENEIHALRCDYRTIHNENDALLGRLFVFSDVTMDADRLTGYHSWERFKLYIKENPSNLELPAVICVCDINGLSIINSAFGREAGDRKIQELANAMKAKLQKSSYFVRGPEANLIAIVYGHNCEAIIDEMRAIESETDISLQYALAETAPEDNSVYPAIKNALGAMKNKKLLDTTSSHSGTLSSLIAALQACDNDTEAHVQRTRNIGLALAKKLGLSDLDQSRLLLLCLMHDIGKIGVPLEILNKPGKLTEAELQVVRSHVQKGYEICKSSPELREIADMVLHHHERWDGRGYPDGQSKETIPLLSRIISVIDAYDAMVSKRVYSAAMSESEAQEEILRCAGSQFDPTLAAELVRLVREKSFYAETVNQAANVPEFISSPGQQKKPVLGNVFEVNYACYIVDSSMRIIQIDDNFTSLTGYTQEDIRTKKLTQFDLIPPEDRAEYAYALNNHEGEKSQAFLEHRIITRNGLKIFVFCFGRNFYNAVAKDMYTQIIIADSLETQSLKILMKREKDLSIKRLETWEDSYRRDPMTGLLNREAFRSEVDLHLIDANQKVMMLMLDVDRFKDYNDTYGHHAGDEFLIKLAHSLKNTMRNEDLACRMGGDEFAAALFYPADSSDDLIYQHAEQIFEQIRGALAGEGIDGSFSMGAVIAKAGTTFMEIYDSSDGALYHSKDQGRGCLTIAGRNIQNDSKNE